MQLVLSLADAQHRVFTARLLTSQPAQPRSGSHAWLAHMACGLSQSDAPKALVQAVGVQRAAALCVLLLELCPHLLQECEGQLLAHPLMCHHQVCCKAHTALHSASKLPVRSNFMSCHNVKGTIPHMSQVEVLALSERKKGRLGNCPRLQATRSVGLTVSTINEVVEGVMVTAEGHVVVPLQVHPP